MTGPSDKDLAMFLRGYIECLRWSSSDTLDDGEEVNLGDSCFELSDDAVEACKADCLAFLGANYADVCAAVEAYVISGEWSGMEQAGHDFALTRNGHGAGFWDRGLPENLSDRLTAASKLAGEVWPYVGDDGLIYIA